MPEEVDRARRIIEEVCVAAEMRGFPLPQDIVKYQMDRTALMGPFIPSSAVDYNLGRPVEYDAIWGTPLQRALAVQAPVPLWQKLCRDIQARLNAAR